MQKQVSAQRGGYLEALLIGSPYAIIATNADGIVTFVNNEACSLLERNMRELIGESITIAYENLAAAQETNRQLYMHGGTIRDHESNVKTKSGKLVRVRISAAHLKDSAGNYAGAVGFFESYRPWTEAESRSRDQVRELECRLEEYKDLVVPIFELFPGLLMTIVACPVESGRLERIRHNLLRSIKDTRARVVILDLSCLASADIDVANQIVKTMRSINLSGARCILAGIQPDLTQTLEPLMGDLSSIKCCGSVDLALETAFDQLGYELRPKRNPGATN